ncbi:hypothetical protein Tco_0697312 [Tanacetum coccineum]
MAYVDFDYVQCDGGIVTGCFGDVKKFLKNGKLENVVAVIKSCTPNALGDLTVTLKDLFAIGANFLEVTSSSSTMGTLPLSLTADPIRARKGGLRAGGEGKIITLLSFAMSAKDAIRSQTYVLSSEELAEFLELYLVPPEYNVMLPKYTQTIYDAPDGYIGSFIFTFLDSIPLDVPNSLPLSLCAKRMVVSIILSFSEVITRIEGWKGQFFFIQNSVVPAEYPQLFSKDNRYPTSVRVFPDPILFLAGLKPSWEFGQQRPTIIIDGEEMSFRNFMYDDTNEDLSFLPKEPYLDDGAGSPSVSINAETPLTIVEATEQLVENTTDSGGSPQSKKLVIHTGCVAGRINERKCKTRGGSSRPPIKRKLVQGTSCLRSSRVKTSHQIHSSFVVISDDDEDATACHLKISAITPPAWKGHLDNQLDLELFDLHDRCYARQAVVDNAVNFKARELLKVVEQIKGECKVLNEREKSMDQECEELRIKCEAAKTYFDKNTNVVALRKKIVNLQGEVKDYRANLDKMLLESHGLAIRLESAEASLRQELENAKRDRAKAGNDPATATFPFLTDVVANPYASVEVLLFKKPRILQRLPLTRTQIPTSSAPSQKATPSPALMSPPPQVNLVTAQSPPLV